MTRAYLFSASEAERVLHCPSSAALPRAEEESEYASKGTMLHAFLEAVATHGRDKALESLGEEDRVVCEQLDLDRLGLAPDRWAAEVAFAWDTEADTSRELGRGLGRAYSALRPTEIPGTADLVGLTETAVVVIDWKTGHGDVAPAADNAQLALLALMAARTYERDEAIVSLVRVNETGTWKDEARLDVFNLDVVAQRMRKAAVLVRAASEEVALGQVPNVSIGSWCRFCPALRTCPGQTALVRAMVDPEAFSSQFPAPPLTLEQAAVVYERVKATRRVLDRIESALYAIARQTPIPLPDGQVLGEVRTSRESLAGPVVRQVVHALFGAEAADACVEYSATKKRLEEALRLVAKERGVPLAQLKREALAAISEAGGLSVKWSTSIKPHRPQNAQENRGKRA